MAPDLTARSSVVFESHGMVGAVVRRGAAGDCVLRESSVASFILVALANSFWKRSLDFAGRRRPDDGWRGRLHQLLALSPRVPKTCSMGRPSGRGFRMASVPE